MTLGQVNGIQIIMLWSLLCKLGPEHIYGKLLKIGWRLEFWKVFHMINVCFRFNWLQNVACREWMLFPFFFSSAIRNWIERRKKITVSYVVYLYTLYYIVTILWIHALWIREFKALFAKIFPSNATANVWTQ